jgi:hypothetical protein
VAVAESKHKLSEVAILRYPNSSVTGGNCKYFSVWKISLVIGSNAGRIVTI